MELFLPLPGLCSKFFFYKMFFICSKGFKIDFQNKKWNHLNWKWNYFSHFQASDKKASLTKCFSFDPRASNLIFETGNGNIQTMSVSQSQSLSLSLSVSVSQSQSLSLSLSVSVSQS